jgi:hypothetical protein
MLSIEQITLARDILKKIDEVGFSKVASNLAKLQGYKSLNEYCTKTGVPRSKFRNDRAVKGLKVLDVFFLDVEKDNNGAEEISK